LVGVTLAVTLGLGLIFVGGPDGELSPSGSLGNGGVNRMTKSAQGAEPVATADKTVLVPVEKAHAAANAKADGKPENDVLVIDVTQLEADNDRPFAIEIAAGCGKEPCDVAGAPAKVSIGQFSIFPSLKTGENRLLKVPLTRETAAELTDHIEVELSPVIQGRSVGANRIRINSAHIEKGTAD